MNTRMCGAAVVGMLLAAAGAVRGENAAATQPQEDAVRDVLPLLHSEVFATREKGYGQLIELGASAMPAIKKLAAAESDAEARARLEKAYDALEEQSVLFGKLVTLDVKDMAVEDVLKEISRQTGRKLAVAGNDKAKKVTLKLDRAPFFAALGEIHKQVPFAWRAGWETTIVVGEAGPFEVFGDGSGAFCGGSIARMGTAELIPKAKTVWNSQLNVRFESGQGVRAKDSVLLEAIQDDKGNTLLAPPAPDDEETHAGRSYSDHSTEFEVELATPEAPGTTIKQIRGTYTMIAVIRKERVSIRFGETKKQGVDAVVRVTRWDVKDGELKIAAHIDRTSLPRETWPALASAMTEYGMRPSLCDARGNMIDSPREFSENAATEDGLVYTATYELTPEQLAAARNGKLLMTIPTRIKKITGEFVLHDISFPR